jgi:hypothetical protein
MEEQSTTETYHIEKISFKEQLFDFWMTYGWAVACGLIAVIILYIIYYFN